MASGNRSGLSVDGHGVAGEAFKGMAAEHFCHLLKRASVLLAIDLEACGEKATLRPRFKNRTLGKLRLF